MYAYVCYVQHSSSLLLVIGDEGGGIQVYADMIFGRRSVMTRMVIPHGHAYPLFIFKLTSIKHLSLITHQQSQGLDDDRVISTYFNCHQNFFASNHSNQLYTLLTSLERSHANLPWVWLAAFSTKSRCAALQGRCCSTALPSPCGTRSVPLKRCGLQELLGKAKLQLAPSYVRPRWPKKN